MDPVAGLPLLVRLSTPLTCELEEEEVVGRLALEQAVAVAVPVLVQVQVQVVMASAWEKLAPPV